MVDQDGIAPAQAAPAVTPLLVTKLYVPALRPQLVSRPGLVERVQAGTLALHGARFGIANGQLEFLDPATGEFAAVD